MKKFLFAERSVVHAIPDGVGSVARARPLSII
jgi:hypothetical protein